MLDTVIKGGIIVDGTGAARHSGDVAIVDGIIVEVGRVTEPARCTIDADGAIVTPGFVDIHSHYDGQLTWDDRLDPSFPHGVTTVVAGNCGVGFAPASPEHRSPLIDMMDGVEDIPELVLAEGLSWEWESFPDYMNLLAGRQYTMDVGLHMTHAPLRVHVMGERALQHESATGADIERMCVLLREGMAAGALGFSAARLVEHRARSGAHVPGTFAERDELLALAEALGSVGRGVFQLVPWGGVGNCAMEQRREEHELMVELCMRAGRPLTYLLQQSQSDPNDWRLFHDWSRDAQLHDVPIYPQYSPRGLGLMMSLDGPHIFAARPSYLAIAELPIAQRLVAMRDPAVRGRILAEENVAELSGQGGVAMLEAGRARLFPIRDQRDYEPLAEQSFGALAAAAGQELDGYIYDFLVSGPAGGVAAFFALNYANGDLHHVREMMLSDAALLGLGDGGAHSRIICDASFPTFALSYWARDRRRGERVPLETVVRKLTRQPAEFYAMADRGQIAPGLRADLNVIDFDGLQLYPPVTRYDLPAGGGRMHQAASGYVATMVNGVTTRLADADTGARPGRLIDGARTSTTHAEQPHRHAPA